jgi:hypothetical protein
MLPDVALAKTVLSFGKFFCVLVVPHHEPRRGADMLVPSYTLT